MDNSTIFTHFYFIKYVFVLVFKKIPLYRGFPLNLLTLNRGPTVVGFLADQPSLGTKKLMNRHQLGLFFLANLWHSGHPRHFFPAWHSVLLLLVAYGAQVSHERRGFYLLSPAEKREKESSRQAPRKALWKLSALIFNKGTFNYGWFLTLWTK